MTEPFDITHLLTPEARERVLNEIRAEAEARGFRQAVEALRNDERFDAWLITQSTMVSDSWYRDYFTDYLESLITEAQP